MVTIALAWNWERYKAELWHEKGDFLAPLWLDESEKKRRDPRHMKAGIQGKSIDLGRSFTDITLESLEMTKKTHLMR